MNRDRHMDDVLDRWLDDGPTRVADRVVAAAMTDVHTTRQRGAILALLEDFLMRLQPLVAPLAVAAVVAVAIGVMTLMNRPSMVGPDATATTAASHAATPVPPSASPSPSEAAPSVDASESPSAEGALLNVNWSVPFAMTAPADWATSPASTSTTQVIDAGIGRYVLFTSTGADTVDGWIERLSADSAMTVTEPEAIELGGAPGFSLTAALNEGEEPKVLLRDGTFSWIVDREAVNRFWIVDVDGETVLIVTESGQRAADSWAASVEAALDTIAWGE